MGLVLIMMNARSLECLFLQFLPEPVVLVIRNNGLESQHRLGFRCLLLMVGIGVPMLPLRVGSSTLTRGFQSTMMWRLLPIELNNDAATSTYRAQQ